MIHISQLSAKRVEKPGDVLAEGQEVLARIIEINPAERRMRLSISALEEPSSGAPSRPRDEDRRSRGRSDRGDHDRHQKNVMSDGEANVTIGELLKNAMQD